MISKTYIDGGSGVAGDMLLGALVGLGLSPHQLEKMLKGVVGRRDWQLAFTHVHRQGWPGWSLHVKGDRPFGSAQDMIRLVRRSRLPSSVRQRATSIFQTLYEAEKDAHQDARPVFEPHGLGLLDTVIDVIGVSWGFWKLGIEQPIASPVNTGRMAPATAYMVKEYKIPVYSDQFSLELATPTGMAILVHLAKEFRPLSLGHLMKAGYGAGTQDRPGRPNVLALYQTQATEPKQQGLKQEAVLLLETVIDDMDPRLYPHVMELLLNAGALDVWWNAIGMKKGRPGIQFSVLCRPDDERRLLALLFQETTTLGIRRSTMERWVLPREKQGLRKVARLPDGTLKSQVEYEVARALAHQRDTPLRKLLK